VLPVPGGHPPIMPRTAGDVDPATADRREEPATGGIGDERPWSIPAGTPTMVMEAESPGDVDVDRGGPP
jgi:hypothetical protein